jgi:hypothetical protein
MYVDVSVSFITFFWNIAVHETPKFAGFVIDSSNLQ